MAPFRIFAKKNAKKLSNFKVGVNLRIKIKLAIAAILMIAYMCVKISILAGLLESTVVTRWIEFFGVVSYILISILLIKDFINLTKHSVSKESIDKMNELENFLDTFLVNFLVPFSNPITLLFISKNSTELLSS